MNRRNLVALIVIFCCVVAFAFWNSTSIRDKVVDVIFNFIFPETHARTHEVNETPQPFKDKASAATLAQIGNQVFARLVERLGGNPEFIKTNVSVDQSSSVIYDTVYISGKHKIAIIYNPMHHVVYPNAVHSTRQEFETQAQQNLARVESGKHTGTFVIVVPFYVDAYVKDTSAVGGWRFDTTISEEERRFKLEQHFIDSLQEYSHL